MIALPSMSNVNLVSEYENVRRQCPLKLHKVLIQIDLPYRCYAMHYQIWSEVFHWDQDSFKVYKKQITGLTRQS